MPDVVMTDLDKIIIIITSGYDIPAEISPEVVDQILAQAKIAPVNNGVKTGRLKSLLLEHFEAIVKEASHKRREINWIAQQGYAWELKATVRLFSEANDLINSVSDQCSIEVFKGNLKNALREKGSDWGHASNWGDSIHRFVMKSLKKELERFIGECSETEIVNYRMGTQLY